MSLTEPQRLQLDKLRRKYRIQFDRQLPQNLSQEQHRIIEAIGKLGGTRYEDYAIQPANDCSREPWKLQAKELALQLTEKVERCKQRGEQSWRRHCEPIVFARADADVACPQCRQRLWRSEIEAARDDGSRVSAALRERQANRQPCRCPPSFRNLDRNEAKGTSKLFCHREDEDIIHSATLEQALGKRQRPDCIYGLRETRNFDVALQSQARAELTSDSRANSDKLVIDMIKVSPMALDGDRLLFPFLFVEAKSGKASDEWDSIKLQTCFPIRTALEIQQGLQRANSSRSRWQSKPLVWFLMYRGEDWRLCMAFAERGTQAFTEYENSYHILELWHGSISDRNGALQLILLVDYVFDWARDVYRPAVLSEVELLVAGRETVPTLYSDTDIYSTNEARFRSPDQENDEPDDSELQRLKEEFHALDSTHGIVRHAACLELRLRGLIITRDNIDTLVRSTSPSTIQPLLRKLLYQIADEPLSIEINTLDEIEKKWTGYTRFTRSLIQNNSRFYAVITFAAYFSSSWDQIEELNIVAVAEDAFEILVEHSGLRAGRAKTNVPKSSRVDASMVMEEVIPLRHQSRSATLMAAITRVHRRLRPRSTTPFELSFERCNGALRGLVQYVYKDFKRGTLEPTEPFLRVSSRFEKIPSTMLPSLNCQTLEDPNASAALVHGRVRQCDGQRARQSDICAFLLNDPIELPDTNTLVSLLKDTFENSDVYHTTRDDRIPNPKLSVRSGTPWNLANTYGVYTKGPEFVEWIIHLGASPPERQGSPRNTIKNGQYLLGRNFTPWKATTRFDIKTNVWAFLFFKIMTTEIYYWRKEAAKRRDAGIPCCSCCGASDLQCKLVLRDESAEPEDVCWLCEAEIHEPGYPRWVWDALLGNQVRQNVHLRSHPKCDCGRPQPHFSTVEETLYRDLRHYSKIQRPYSDICSLWDQANQYSTHQWGKSARSLRANLDVEEARTETDDPETIFEVDAPPKSNVNEKAGSSLRIGSSLGSRASTGARKTFKDNANSKTDADFSCDVIILD